MKRDRTCICVLNWNTRARTLECLSSIEAVARDMDTIVVCDNGSTDDSRPEIVGWAKQRYGESGTLILEDSCETESREQRNVPFVFIDIGRNLGYAAGNNRGIRYALSQDGFEYVWILNSDTFVAPGALQALCRCAETNNNVGVFGSTLLSSDQPDLVQCAGGCRYNPLTTTFRAVLGGRSRNAVMAAPSSPALDYVSGAAFFARTAVFRDCGLFCEDYFLYYEELDFCARARQAGYELAWCKESTVYHQGGMSIAAVCANDAAVRAQFSSYHENLSTLIFTKNHFFWLLPVVMAYRFSAKAVLCLKRRQWHVMRAVTQAYSDFLRGRNQRGDFGS